MILEIFALRKSLDRIQEWFDYVDKNVEDRGQLGGGNGKLQGCATFSGRKRGALG
ncbi:hypothetical protein [Burkholderia lata]|uniref:hypothetical protein n=1 Tax=Burkholderia lata (strain ATCC 17760 / DSM 23089 / LMG 22485 / NCIMB 9086 / R18194 / 383) TaxID=482957 RepID=UPI0020C5F927|nr:hypothetical protein [Burkholderia lata]